MSAHGLDQASVVPRRVHNGGWSTDATDPEMVRALARRIIRPVRERARELGWAIGMHGSLERDIDLIAVPWTERAVETEALVNSVRQVLDKLYGVGLEVGPNEAHPKPHGRLCWSFWIRPWTYIDLSIWPSDHRIKALTEERDHWKRIAHDRLISANEQLARAREAEVALAVCRQTIAEQASARLDPTMPLLIERVVIGLREDSEARYALAETLEERQEAHGLAMLCDWQDARRAARNPASDHG